MISFSRSVVNVQDFVDGMRELVRGRDRQAFEYLQKAAHLADGAFMAGLLGLKLDRPDKAERALKQAARKHAGLGRYFQKYGIEATANLWITEHVGTLVAPDMRGVLLGLSPAIASAGS